MNQTGRKTSIATRQSQFSSKPLTRNGLSGNRPISQQREIHDKTYFINLYKKKIEALDYEMISLEGKLKDMNDIDDKENQIRLVKAESEVKLWFDQLQIINIFLEKQRILSTLDDLQKDLLVIKKNREMDVDQLELILTQKQIKEKLVLETTVQVELLQKEMDTKMQKSSYNQQYMDKSNLIALNSQMTEQQRQQTKLIKSQIEALSMKLDIRGDLYKDYKYKILEYTRKSLELDKIKLKPTQEDQQTLIQQTQFEVSVLEQQIMEYEKELEVEKFRNQQNMAIQSENDMVEFISQFVIQKPSLEMEIKALTEEINEKESALSLAIPENLPSLEKYQELQHLLSMKKVEVNTAEQTFEELLKEKEERLQEIQRLEILAMKIDEEIDKLIKNSIVLEQKVEDYVNMDDTKKQLEVQKRELLLKRNEYELIISKFKPIVEELENQMLLAINKLAIDSQHSDYIALLVKLNGFRQKLHASQLCTWY